MSTRLSYRQLAGMAFLAVALYGLFLLAEFCTLEEAKAGMEAGASSEYGQAQGTPTLVVPWRPRRKK